MFFATFEVKKEKNANINSRGNMMIKFKNMANEDKPRERLYNYGSEVLANEELIAIILKTGSKGHNVKEVALKLMEQVGDIRKLRDIGIPTLMKVEGIGKVKATELKAALELGRRVYAENNMEKRKLNNDYLVYEYFKEILRDKKQEYFYAVYLDTKGNYLGKKCLFVGTINNSVVHPREIFKEAYLLSANGIICVHNHPSGDVTPSKEDINLTKKLVEIGVIHGINVIDHIIIGDNKYYSFYHDKKM